MTEYVCDQDCQVRLPDGKIVHKLRGDLLVWPDDIEEGQPEEPPRHLFRLLGGQELDFSTASEAELKAAKWSYKAINAFTMAKFNKTMPRKAKDAMIAELLDMRFRAIGG